MSGEKPINNLLAKVATDYEETGSLQTVGAESALREDEAMRNGQMDKRYSLLSPRRKENEEAAETGYISPFSDEFLERSDKRDEEYQKETEEAESIPSSRIKAYLLLAAVLYVIALGIGYHNTPWSDGYPQTISGERIDAREYLSGSEEHILYLQTAHTQSVEAIEKYTGGLMSSSELAGEMRKANDALAKKEQELREMTVPKDCEPLQENLLELYSLQTSMNSAAVNYAARKADDTFDVLDNINEKYRERSDEVLSAFDAEFSH